MIIFHLEQIRQQVQLLHKSIIYGNYSEVEYDWCKHNNV